MRLSKGMVEQRRHYFRNAPGFESGVGKFAWLFDIASVGYGELYYL